MFNRVRLHDKTDNLRSFELLLSLLIAKALVVLDIHKVLDFTQLILNWKQVEAESQNFAIHNLEIQMICVIALKQHKG